MSTKDWDLRTIQTTKITLASRHVYPSEPSDGNKFERSARNRTQAKGLSRRSRRLSLTENGSDLEDCAKDTNARQGLGLSCLSFAQPSIYVWANASTSPTSCSARPSGCCSYVLSLADRCELKKWPATLFTFFFVLFTQRYFCWFFPLQLDFVDAAFTSQLLPILNSWLFVPC